MRVVYREKSLVARLTGAHAPPFIAESIAAGPFSRVHVGPGFMSRPDCECQAILAHECGHIAGWHSVIRVLWCLLLLPMWAPRWVEMHSYAQEIAADRYACMRGHRSALLSALLSMRGVYRDRHLDARIARLQGEAMYE